MTITPDKVRHSGMSDKLGTDVIAVDALGNILTRAGDEAAARRAAPDAAAFYTGEDFNETAPAEPPTTPAPAAPDEAFTAVVAQVDPAVLKDYKASEPANAAEPAAADGSAFDHDKDGKTGGSKKGAESTAAKGKASRDRKLA